MKVILALALVLVGIPHEARTQEREPDALYLTGEVVSGVASGGTGQAEWLRWLSSRSNITLGGASTSLMDLWWSYGTLSAFRRTDHFMLSGRISAGSGHSRASPFTYGRYAASATVPIASGFYAEIEGQHVHLARQTSTLFKFGGLYVGPRYFTFRLAYFTGSSAGVPSNSVLGHAELTLGRFGVWGGATTSLVGHRHGTNAIEIVTQPPRSVFGGASIAAGRSRLLGAFELLPQQTGRLTRVTATLQLPLGKSRPLP